MAERIQVQKVKSTQESDAELETTTAKVDSTEALQDIDDILEEIDSVLETNAEEFVKGFVQKGGE